MKLDNRFFNLYESEDVEKLFTSDETLEKDIYLCCIEDEENRDLIIYNLVKKGYIPISVNSEKEINSSNFILIKNSLISKFSNKVGAVVKDDIVYFYFDGFLDASIVSRFDIEYFRRTLLIGFKVFVFNMTHVKGLNIHAVHFLSRLGVESAEYSALMIILGLNTKNIQKALLSDLDVVGYLFFEKEDDLLTSEEVKEAKEFMQVSYKKQKKITKDFVKLLPYFVNSTIETIELMTGIKAQKEKPELTNIELNLENEEYIASSIGFYGDIDGIVVLIFIETLTKKISKILLGEEVQSKEELNDIVSEFANIIVGNTKTEFSKNETIINMTLPKVFDNLEQLKTLVNEKKAVEVKFYFEDDEFYFYLTR
jgi:CheY-specific phosphatase CheX